MADAVLLSEEAVRVTGAAWPIDGGDGQLQLTGRFPDGPGAKRRGRGAPSDATPAFLRQGIDVRAGSAAALPFGSRATALPYSVSACRGIDTGPRPTPASLSMLSLGGRAGQRAGDAP